MQEREKLENKLDNSYKILDQLRSNETAANK